MDELEGPFFRLWTGVIEQVWGHHLHMRSAYAGLLAAVVSVFLVALPATAGAPAPGNRSSVSIHLTADIRVAAPDVVFTIRLRNATQHRLRELRLESSQLWDGTAGGTDGV
ncbi:MAG: hypothetical protein QOG53_3492, partial [Frankiales bacterium]|nr:hypothetical protein [Frankiales bacterium]